MNALAPNEHQVRRDNAVVAERDLQNRVRRALSAAGLAATTRRGRYGTAVYSDDPLAVPLGTLEQALVAARMRRRAP